MEPPVIKMYPNTLNNSNRLFVINLPYVTDSDSVFLLSRNSPNIFNVENSAIVGEKRIKIVILGNIFIPKMSGKISVAILIKTVK